MSGSGRRDEFGNALPPRMHRKKGAYWHVVKNKWHRLGSRYVRALAEYQMRENRGESFSDLVDRAMAHIKGRKLKDRTWRQYTYIAKEIKAAFCDFRPDEITATHVSVWHDDMIDTPNMANRCLTVMRMVCERGIRWGEMSFDPTAGVRRHREKKRTRYLTDAEYRAVRDHARPWLRNLVDFLYLTGQRVGDALTVKLKDISDEGVYFEQEKTGARILVAMSPELAAVIADQKRVNGLRANPYLFAAGRQSAHKVSPYVYDAARDAWNRACKRARVTDATLHDLRAKSLSDADREGKDAQQLGGHSSRQMTKRYLRLISTVTVSGPRALDHS